MREEKRLAEAGKIASVVLGAAGILCLLILFYFLYHYAWARDRHFTSPFSPLLYYAFPAVLAGLCFASLRLRSSHRVNLALLLVSVGFWVYAVEVMTTIWFSLPSVIAEAHVEERVRAARERGIDFDTRSVFDVSNDLRKKGVDAYPIFYPDAALKKQPGYGHALLPLGGMSKKLSVLCNESGEYVTYESDERGFHNPNGFWSKGRFEIVALGDSYVQGFCVPPEKNFVAWIRKSRPDTLNLGVASMGPLFMLGAMKEYAQPVEPKVVLWFYYEGNDLRDLTVEMKNPLLMRYMEGGFSQDLLNRKAGIDQAVADMLEKAKKRRRWNRVNEIWEAVRQPSSLAKKGRSILTLSQLRGSLGLIAGENRSLSSHIRSAEPDKRAQSVEYQAEIDLFGKILSHANEVVNTWGGKLYFVYLPGWHRYARPEYAEKNRDRVLLLAESIGLRTIDLHTAFQAQKDPLALFPFRLHNHYNEAGHRLVAEEVLRSISLPPRASSAQPAWQESKVNG